MVKPKSDYEECRRLRMEENRRRMQELNLFGLSNSLKASKTPKQSPYKVKRARRQPVEQVRRSSRVANKPAPNYNYDGLEPLFTRRRSYQRRLLTGAHASEEERVYATERAEELQSSLDTQFPSLVKPMKSSHVSGGFWLGLPTQFCKDHLPSTVETITLIDEEGDEFPSKYLAYKTGLSGGWRTFAMDHGLIDGDCLVFQLVEPTKFKVYIFRCMEPEENEEKEVIEDNEERKAIEDNEEKEAVEDRGEKKHKEFQEEKSSR